jgi:hypothetical protein
MFIGKNDLFHLSSFFQSYTFRLQRLVSQQSAVSSDPVLTRYQIESWILRLVEASGLACQNGL